MTPLDCVKDEVPILPQENFVEEWLEPQSSKLRTTPSKVTPEEDVLLKELVNSIDLEDVMLSSVSAAPIT